MGIFSPLIYQKIISDNLFLWITSSLILFVGYGGLKIKFKKMSTFKYFLFKKYVQLRWSLKNFNEKIHYDENPEIQPIQQKSIRLWKLLLRDEESQISCSLVDKIRQIEKDNMLLILSPTNQIDFQLTIMDVDSTKSCLYEIPISGKYSSSLIEYFDNENQRRMVSGQTEKKQSIHSDLDKLISQQEMTLKNKVKSKA